nr:MAG TPA: hypothetical protein [Bacteriophage sp.]
MAMYIADLQRKSGVLRSEGYVRWSVARLWKCPVMLCTAKATLSRADYSHGKARQCLAG